MEDLSVPWKQVFRCTLVLYFTGKENKYANIPPLRLPHYCQSNIVSKSKWRKYLFNCVVFATCTARNLCVFMSPASAGVLVCNCVGVKRSMPAAAFLQMPPLHWNQYIRPWGVWVWPLWTHFHNHLHFLRMGAALDSCVLFSHFL